MVKNFVKAFRKFINNLDEKQAIEDNFDGKSCLEEILNYCNEFIDKRNFNNQMMRDICSDEKLKTLFLYFLKSKADAWIQEGNVHDKSGHQIAKEEYIQLIENPEES